MEAGSETLLQGKGAFDAGVKVLKETEPKLWRLGPDLIN